MTNTFCRLVVGVPIEERTTALEHSIKTPRPGRFVVGAVEVTAAVEDALLVMLAIAAGGTKQC